MTIDDNTPTNGKAELVPTTGGNGGLVLRPDGRPDRSYARSIITMMRFQRESGETIFTEDQVVSLIQHAIPLAESAAAVESQRDYSAMMKVLTELVKLEQTELAREEPQKHEHEHTVVTIEHQRASVDALIQRELERRGGDEPPETNGHAGTNGSGSVLPP